MPRGGILLIELIVVRVVFVTVLAACAYFLRPFQADGVLAALAGLALGGAIIVFERRVQQVRLKRLICGAVRSVVGNFAAFLMYPVIATTAACGYTPCHVAKIAV